MTRLTAIVGILTISLSAIFVRLADATPSTAAFLRTAYAAPFLWLIWNLGRRNDRRSRRERWLAFTSGVFLGVDLVVWHRAIGLIGAGLGTVLANTQVVFVGVAAWILHRERPRMRAFLIIPVVFAGVVLISGLGRPDAHGVNPRAGTVYGVLAGVSYAVFLLMFRASNRALAPPAGPLLDATLGAAICSLAWASIEGSLQLGIEASAHAWLLLLAILPHVGGWLLISAALPRLPALDTSVLLLLQPMATVLWALLIFGEWLSGVQWSGVALVMGGIAWLSMGGTVAAAPEVGPRMGRPRMRRSPMGRPSMDRPATDRPPGGGSKRTGEPDAQAREFGFERQSCSSPQRGTRCPSEETS